MRLELARERLPPLGANAERGDGADAGVGEAIGVAGTLAWEGRVLGEAESGPEEALNSDYRRSRSEI
jgi:hypothetical protein